MTGTSGGLGRGLAAILTGPGTQQTDHGLRSRFVESALTSLDGGKRLQYCCYVHDPDDEAEVTMRSPELTSLHPTSAYRLFTDIGAAADAGDGHHVGSLGDVTTHAIGCSRGSRRALFFFGDERLDESDVTRLASFCSVYAPVILEHDVPPRPSETLHLVLDQHGSEVHAQVSDNDHMGSGAAERPQEAAAQAAVSSQRRDAKLVQVAEVRARGCGAVFVVASDAHGDISMGAAPVSAGPDAAAALAALRAARSLSR